MQNLAICNVMDSKKNDKNIMVQFKGSVLRSELPEHFNNSNNSPATAYSRLLSASLGNSLNNTHLGFTTWWVFSKEIFAQHCVNGNMYDSKSWPVDIDKLFSSILKDDETIIGIVARSTFDLDGKKERKVLNPTTGEILQFEGLDLNTYTTIGIGKKGDANKALFLFNDKPECIKVKEINVTTNVVESDATVV